MCKWGLASHRGLVKLYLTLTALSMPISEECSREVMPGSPPPPLFIIFLKGEEPGNETVTDLTSEPKVDNVYLVIRVDERAS